MQNEDWAKLYEDCVQAALWHPVALAGLVAGVVLALILVLQGRRWLAVALLCVTAALFAGQILVFYESNCVELLG